MLSPADWLALCPAPRLLIRCHLRAPLLTVAAGVGPWAYCLRQVHGTDAVATDLFAPEDNPRFRRPGWYLVQPMDLLAALCRCPDHDLLAVCPPPGLGLQQVYEAVPQAISRQFTGSAFAAAVL